MKNIILLILFLIITFILNVIFYYNSSDYRTFLKGLKNSENIENIKNKEEYLGNIKEKIEKKKIEDEIKKIKNNDIQKVDSIEKEIITPKLEIKLGKKYTDFLVNFSKYNLEKLELNTNLFDITSEYPDKYFEYYSRNLTVYLFPTRSYEEVISIFEVLSTELPFTINKTNNFGEESFYINLNSEIDDSIVRVVVKNKNIVFGLKIKKNEYNNVKQILDNLK